MALQAKATVDLPDSNQAMHVPAGTGTAYWGPGELMTFLITSEESGGALFMSEISVAPAEAPRPTSTTTRTRHSACSKAR